MKKNVHDGEAPRVRKVLMCFLVEKVLGDQLKDAAWNQRKTLSQLLREYCRAGLRRKARAKDRLAGTTRSTDHRIRNNNEAHAKED
jgi:hypothetical protein